MFRSLKIRINQVKLYQWVNLARWGIAIEKRGLLTEVKNLAWHSKIDKTKKLDLGGEGERGDMLFQ